MPKFQRARKVAGVLFAATVLLLTAAPAAASAADPGEASRAVGGLVSMADPTPAPTLTPDQICDAIDEIIAVGAGDSVRIANEILTQVPVADPAGEVTRCLAAKGAALSDDEAIDAVCAIAIDLNKAEKYEATVKIVEGIKAATGSTDACDKQLQAAQKELKATTSPAGLGKLWDDFQKTVLTPLASVAGFIGLAVLVFVALGRILALIPPFRDPAAWLQRRWTRRGAAWVGTILAVLWSSTVALLGMWWSGTGGASDTALAPEAGFFPEFIFAVGANAWPTWLILALLAALILWVLAWAFGSRLRVTITPKAKDDDDGIDSARLIAAVDGMGGSLNRGVEFPVGTDVTTAAAAVTDLSANKFISALQAIFKALVGASPWLLAVESESADAASITISRNGKLIKAKRIRIEKGNPLYGLDRPAPADRLAALVAGELLAALRLRYQREFDSGLSGATDGESIALHYLATTSLSASPDLREDGIKVLARALERDPGNRAAATTRANFVYRGPEAGASGAPQLAWHSTYRRQLERSIDQEMRHVRTTTGLTRKLREAFQLDDLFERIGTSAQHARRHALRGNRLLTRMLGNYAVASANEIAVLDQTGDPVGAAKLRAESASHRWLRVWASGGRAERFESPPLRIQRRQLLLIDEFQADFELRNASSAPSVYELPTALNYRMFRAERRAWEKVAANQLAAGVPRTPLAQLIERQDAVLAVSGDFTHDPAVSYALACHRSVCWMPQPEAGGENAPQA